MINSRLDSAYKAQWGAASFHPRDRMAARTLHILFHFLVGIALAAFLLPEGTAILLGSFALVIAMKALYDYVDTGRVKLTCAAAIALGGLVSWGVSLLI